MTYCGCSSKLESVPQFCMGICTIVLKGGADLQRAAAAWRHADPASLLLQLQPQLLPVGAPCNEAWTQVLVASSSDLCHL